MVDSCHSLLFPPLSANPVLASPLARQNYQPMGCANVPVHHIERPQTWPVRFLSPGAPYILHRSFIREQIRSGSVYFWCENESSASDSGPEPSTVKPWFFLLPPPCLFFFFHSFPAVTAEPATELGRFAACLYWATLDWGRSRAFTRACKLL